MLHYKLLPLGIKLFKSDPNFTFTFKYYLLDSGQESNYRLQPENGKQGNLLC